MTYTIQDHGPDTHGLYKDGKRIAVLAECDQATAEQIARDLNACITQDEELDILKSVLNDCYEAFRSLDGAALTHPECDLASKMLKETNEAIHVHGSPVGRFLPPDEVQRRLYTAEVTAVNLLATLKDAASRLESCAKLQGNSPEAVAALMSNFLPVIARCSHVGFGWLSPEQAAELRKERDRAIEQKADLAANLENYIIAHDGQALVCSTDVEREFNLLAKERGAALRILWSCGLSPSAYPQLEAAASSVIRIIVYLRAQLANPPPDLEELVLKRAGLAEVPRKGEALRELREAKKMMGDITALTDYDTDTLGCAELAIERAIHALDAGKGTVYEEK